MLKRIFNLCFIIFLVVGNLNAQSYNFVRFGVREGLLHSLVTGITQDKRGDIWMSTGGGLCRFDGVEFKYITTKDGLNFTRLTCVATDEDDNIWVGSSQGLNFICGKSIKTIQDSLIESEILAISSAGKSMIWAVSNRGLFKVQFLNEKFIVTKINIPLFQSLASSQIFQDRILTSFIFQTKAGKVFYGNNGEPFCIQNDKIDKIKTESSLHVNTGIELLDGSVLFGTNKGIYRLENDHLVTFNNTSTSKIDIRNLQFDGEKIWLLGKEFIDGKTETNLYAIDLENPEYFRKIGRNNGLIDEPTHMSIDHEGNIWTTSNNGVNLLKPSAFVAYTSADGMVGNKSWGIYRTKDGSLWVGTIGEGLTVTKDNKYLNYNIKNGLPDNYIGRIYQARNGDIFIGTSSAGICKAVYNNTTNTYAFIRLPLLLGSKLRIDDIVEDKQGLLWVASSRGLFYTKNNKDFKRFKLFQNDTGQVFVQKLLIDSLRNVMWIGTRYNGVFLKIGNLAKQFDKLDRKEEVSSLAMDCYGDIWIGTRTKGVFHCEGEKITRLMEKDGLASNLIFVLHPDKHNNLWVGTNLGLDRVDLEALENKGRTEIRHYGSDEGLVDLEINLNGVFEDNEFGFWIATNGGLLKYERAADKPNNIPPKVRILDLKLNSQETNWQKFSTSVNPWNGLPDILNLEYFQNHLTFEFVGVSFRNPKMVKYAWRLDGFDSDWITSTSRQAIYSNIPPGNYTFRLKAANRDLVWSNDVVSMPFTVGVPFWETWWFRISMVLLLAVVIYIYVLTRIRSLREKQKELENLVGIRTLELSEQFEIVDKKNKQILDSLMYAKFLQNAILTPVEEIKANFSDAFIYNRPKDLVSGDFYWHSRKDDISVFAVADCTGHGVPGAIISVICENALRQAVMSCNYENPAQILQQANKYVIDTFTHTHKDIHPGMEIALCSFNHTTYELTFSGAKLGMYVVVNGDLIRLKSSVYRIGWDLSIPSFSNEILKLTKGDILYLFTDGFGDQFEPKSKKKFSSARLKKLLYENINLPSAELRDLLDKEFETWQGVYDQIDDVLVVGIKV
jgi:ligand-binding sensor domain-containing protein/serine phosphatase RsbU (regulator of sigma subunit)